jgi:hypothetical protein
MTPGKAIRKFCLACVGTATEVHKCQGNKMLIGDPCPLYPYRLGKGRPSVKTIRKHCLYCCNNSRKLVRECPDESCPLYKFRLGTNPNYKPKQNDLKNKGPAGKFCSNF